MTPKFSAFLLSTSVVLCLGTANAGVRGDAKQEPSVVSYGSGYCDTSWDSSWNDDCHDGRSHHNRVDLDDCGGYNDSSNGAAIPEAGTYSLAFGAMALGIVVLRRRG